MGEPEEKSSSDNLSVKESPVHKLDIPDHLIEIPAPEQLSKLDRTMDSVIDDINILLDGRSKEFQANGESRARLPVFPEQFHFASFRKERAKALEKVVQIDNPVLPKSFSEAAIKEIQNDWQIEKLYEEGKLSAILFEFFNSKKHLIMKENSLLISRWIRFCRTSVDAAKLSPIFKLRQQQLKAEYTDTVNRYERFYEAKSISEMKAAERQAEEEAQRIKDERNGLAVLRKDAPERVKDAEDDPSSAYQKSALSPAFGEKELPAKNIFNLADLTIYLRWLITTRQEGHELQHFFTKSKNVIYSDTMEFLKDYSSITTYQAGQDLGDNLKYFEGINGFIPNTPMVPPRIEDFFVEFDNLVQFSKVETFIGQEDGRPFAYEVDHKFMETLYDQCTELTLIPYDKTSMMEDSAIENPAAGNGIGGYNGSIGLDTAVITLSTISGVSSKLSRNKMSRVRNADWLHLKQIIPNPSEAEDRYSEFLNSLVETDMELKLEYDVLLLADNDTILAHMKQISRRAWEKAASVPNCRPVNTKINIIPQNREQKKDTEPLELRHPKLFDLSLKIPNGNYENKMGNILAEKRIAYAQILKANEDTKKLELEIKNADPNSEFDESNYITPTIASIFAEHEMLAYFELRFVRIRDFRIRILRQLNFFRSIQKRLVIDLAEMENIANGKKKNDPLVSSLVDMWVNQEFFDPSAKKDGNKNDRPPWCNEDIRTTVNDRVFISDHKGIPFLYDVALDDLKEFDEEMIKILTGFINSKAREGGIDLVYLDELRCRKSDRSEENSNITFRNPSADRYQMILEYYEAYHDYNFAKIELINCYMEAYENTVRIPKAKEISQILTDMINAKPMMNFEDEYFSKGFVQAKTSLILHAQVVEDLINQISNSHRDWIHRYQPQKMQTDEGSNHKKTNDQSHSKKPIFFSLLKPGLPVNNHKSDDIPSITMHHPSFSFGVTEIIPGLDQVIEISKALKSCSKEAEILIASISKKRFDFHAADCAILKFIISYWNSLGENQFRSPLNKKGTLLEATSYFLNPYLPDAILKDIYVPFDQTSEGNFKSLEINLEERNVFNDPSFLSDGLEILYRFLQVISLENRISNNWMECENWRKIFDGQLIQGQIKKVHVTTRFPSLKFDSIQETTKELHADEDQGEDLEAELNDVTVDMDDEKNINAFKFGPLAYAELDDTMLSIEPTGLAAIIFLMQKDGVSRLKKILRIQILEKYWFHSATEMTKIIFNEFYQRRILLEDPDKALEMEKTGAADLQGLIPTILNQKKILRKIITNEYSKEYRVLVLEDMPDQERENRLKKFKSSLLDFYSNNMVQIVSQEIEKAEFSKFMTDFKCTLDHTNFTPLLFYVSPITKYSEFLAGFDINETGKSALKQPASTQGLLYNGNITEKLAKLWYIPHISQLIVGMARQEKIHKSAVDLNGVIFKNSLTYSRSYKVHYLVQQIFSLVSSISALLQGNQKYSSAVSSVREADYVVNTINAIKRDFQMQGENGDYARIYKGLTLRWQYWFLKWKYILATGITCLKFNLMSSDVEKLEYQYQKSISNKWKKQSDPFGRFYRKPLQVKERRFGENTNLHPPKHIFASLSSAAKSLCSYRVSEIEDDLEEQSSAVQSENRDDVKQKWKIDNIASGLKCLQLQKAYMKQYRGDENGSFKTEDERNSYFQKFKMRIIVPAIKLYQTGGSKGGLSMEFLLRDTNISGAVENFYKPMFSQSDYDRNGVYAFEKCKHVILQNELLRSFTLNYLTRAKEYFEHLTDERIGRLFRASDNIEIDSIANNPDLAFRLSEIDYGVKSEIFNEFLNDLFEASKEYINELRIQQKKQFNIPTIAGMATLGQGLKDEFVLNLPFDQKKIFACKKNTLGKVISKFAVRLNKWQTDRKAEQEQFYATMQAHLIEMFKSTEKIILHQNQEKKEAHNQFQRNSKLYAHELALEAFTSMASMEVELAEAKKNKRVDEKRIRNKILDEYDSLVDELVREISILRNRFREYQVSNFNEILNIMAESKTEHLVTMESNENLTLAMRNAISTIIKHDQQMKSYQDQNFELKMTILKIRSMFIMKEQGAKSFFQSKLRTLTELNNETEAKLWDSFREGESRERALRKQLARSLKAKALVEVQNELLHSQLREGQDKSHGPALNDQNPAMTGRKNGATSQQAKSKYVLDLESKLKRYEGINIENLIQELTNKTALAEELLQEKHHREKIMRRPGALQRGGTKIGSSLTLNQAIKRHGKFTQRQEKSTQRQETSGQEDSVPLLSQKRTTPSPAFGQSPLAVAAEPVKMLPKHYMMNQERIQELETENMALRRKLFLNGIALPEESKKSLANPAHQSSSRGTTPSLSRPQTATLVDSRSCSRPMTAASSRPRTAASSRPMTAVARPSRPITASILKGSGGRHTSSVADEKLPDIQRKISFA